ncbi:MAG TPA: four helix bundle protein [Chitinophagaceae bacterium]
MATQSFRQLIVWQKAHQFVLGVYKYTSVFPKAEMYALTSQFKRAAVSIAANIAEGYKKKGKADKARLMNIAQGSIEECQYYLILSNDLGYGKNDDLAFLLNEIGKMLESYISKILSSNS